MFQPVVAGRGIVDTYLMARVDELKKSLVDVTYATMMLHQGFDNYLEKSKRMGTQPKDQFFNTDIFLGLKMKKICMSIPGDRVVCRKKGKGVMGRLEEPGIDHGAVEPGSEAEGETERETDRGVEKWDGDAPETCCLVVVDFFCCFFIKYDEFERRCGKPKVLCG